jgi:hypothetical protein
MANLNLMSSDVLAIDDVPLDLRAEKLEGVFRALSPGEVFWVAGRGDVHHYERYLHARFPGKIDWVDDFDLNGRWIARVARK